jgi:spore maturation protein SpmA
MFLLSNKFFNTSQVFLLPTHISAHRGDQATNSSAIIHQDRVA